MAIDNKDVLDMSPAFFAELTDVAVTEKGLGSWTKLATGKPADLEKVAKGLSYLATNPVSRAMTGSLPTAAAYGGIGAVAGGPAGAAAGAGIGLITGALGRWLRARGTLGRINKAKKLGKHPFHFLTASEKSAIKTGKLRLPEKRKALTQSPATTVTELP